VKFDRFGDSEPASALMPDGTHECEIAKVKEVVRKSDGCEVIVITMVATDGDFEPVEKWLDPGEKRDHRAAMQLLSSLGLPADADVDDSLVGRRVMVTTKAGASKKTGMPVVYVNAFAPAEAAYEQDNANAKPAAKPVSRSQAAKAHREFTANSGSPDDIPF